MDDHPRPKKKSRFFSDGNTILSSLLHRRGSATAKKLKGEPAPQKLNDHSERSPPFTHPVSLDVSQASAPLSAATLHTSEGITPTDTAFKGLTVGDKAGKTARRKAIYGSQDLFPQQEQYQDKSTSDYQQDQRPISSHEHSNALPWEKGSLQQQANIRHQPLLNVNVDAATESPFTFRAPLEQSFDTAKYGIQPQQPQSLTNSQQPFSANDPPRSFIPEESSIVQNIRARTEFPPVPPTPTIPNLSLVSGPHNGFTPPNPEQVQRSPISRGGVDTDRDFDGGRVRDTGYHRLPKPSPGFRPTTPHAYRPNTRGYAYPENAMTSPNRVQRASEYAGRKRKRTDNILPAPAFIYTRKNDPKFSVFRGILLYPELCYHLASHLPVEDLISLYAISKDFHTIIDTRFTTVILSQSLKKAPTSSRIFPFRSYGHLCRKDPAARIAHPDPAKAKAGQVRRIPSFRWLRMVLYREKAVHAMMALFAERGIPLPRRCELTMKKIWFMMDIPDNARRIGFVHNKKLLSDTDLYFGACLLVKLDMLFTDPVSAHKRAEGRQLVLSQPGLGLLLRVLKGEALNTRWSIMHEWIKLKYDPGENAPTDPDETLFGLPQAEWGRMQREYWGRKLDKNGVPVPVNTLSTLLRPDQLIVREAVKRGLRFAGHYVRFMLYGYVHPKTLDDFEPREMTRWIGEYNEEDYAVDDVVARARALALEDGGGPLLDLGAKLPASRSIRRAELTRVEVEENMKEHGMLARMYADSQREQHDLGLI